MNYKEMDYITLRRHQLVIEHLIVTMRIEAAAKFKQAVDETLKTPRQPHRAQYQNPADPAQTWSGRGRIPIWMAEAMEANGTAKEDYLVNGP